MTPAEQHHAMRIAQLEETTGQTWEHEGTSRYICTEQVTAYCYFSESHGCTMRVAGCVDLCGAEVHLHATASDPDINRAWAVARNARDAATKRLTETP